MINQAALKAGAPEVALAVFDELNLLGLTLTDEAMQAYAAALKTVMEEMAARGNIVIVGRASQISLAHRPDTLHVRIIAPLEVRAARIAERQHISRAAARKQVEASDRNRRSFIKRLFSVNWEDPALYDLTVNTGRIDTENACRIILQALPRPDLHPPSQPTQNSGV